MHSGRWEWLVWVSLPKDEGGCLAGPREGQAGSSQGAVLVTWACILWPVGHPSEDPGGGCTWER